MPHTTVHIYETEPLPKVSVDQWEHEGTKGVTLSVEIWDEQRTHTDQIAITVYDAHGPAFLDGLTRAIERFKAGVTQ